MYRVLRYLVKSRYLLNYTKCAYLLVLGPIGADINSSYFISFIIFVIPILSHSVCISCWTTDKYANFLQSPFVFYRTLIHTYPRSLSLGTLVICSTTRETSWILKTESVPTVYILSYSLFKTLSHWIPTISLLACILRWALNQKRAVIISAVSNSMIGT